MKLLYLSNQRLPTEKAYGRQIAKMCSALSMLMDVELELIYPSRHNHIKASFLEYYGVKENFKVSRIWAPDFYLPGRLEILAFGVKNLISALVLVKAALFRKADIIYSRDELPLYILSFFSPTLIHKCGMVFEAHKLSSSRFFMYRRFRRKKLKIVAITAALKNEFIKLGFDPSRILVATDGVDLSVIQQEANNPVDRKLARDSLQLPLDRKIAVYTGSIYDWKGVYTLTDAAKLVSDILFVVVGGDQRGDEATFRQYLVDHHIENVVVTGYIQSEETVRNYLAAADVLLLPNTARDKVSRNYTSPLKLFLYMAARRPIVASDLPSLREVLSENNSILVKPDDATALADGIKRIFADDILAHRLSQQAFEDVKPYSWEERAKEILHFVKTPQK